ncbi:MAG: hypothetical protein E5Y58_24545 [Mesorhizobium sp.]|nr:MAG: hypothetical protein E5Y58_24545 [Mesorhizobium sp.]
MPVLLSSSGGSYRSFPSCVFLIVLEKPVVAQVHWHQIAVGAEVGADAMMPNSMKMSCGTRHGCRAAEAVIRGSIAAFAAPSSLRAIKVPCCRLPAVAEAIFMG